MPRVWRYPVPRGARAAPPTTPSNPAPPPQQQQHRSPRSPELQRSPATEFNENEIADGGLVAAPAGGGPRCRRRSCRRGPRAREPVDKEEERGAYTAAVSMPRVWRYPVPRGARPAPPTTPSNPAPRPQQQQHRSPRSPELQRSPATEFNENEIADGGLVAAPAGGGSRCRRRSCRRGPRARESMDKEEERGPKLPQFQCRVFGDTRYLAARGRRRRPHHRIRRRGRSSSSIGRPDRPSSSVPPQPNLTKTKSPTAALWRPQQVAGRAVDGAHAGAALVRASQWIKKRNAGPTRPQFQCRVFGDTRYLAARGRRRRPHHRIRRRGRSSSSIGRPDRPSSS